MLLDSLKSPLVHFACGVIKEKLNVSEQQAVIEDTVLTLSSTSEKKNIQTIQSSKNVFATVECPLTDKKKIWKDKLSISQLNSLTIIIKDIGSGLNFKRKGFNSILDFAIKGDIQEVVVTHKDRLCRFGFELIERIITEYSNGKIVVLNQEKTSPEKELVDDLISIVTVFSSRLYGLRSHSIKKQIKEATKNVESKTVSH
jgi:hypothetical protein